MNTEELKRRLAKEGAVTELDTRDAYAVEWTVAAMSSNAKGIEGKNWRQQFKEDFYRDNNILTAKDLDKAWAIAERHALMAYKYIYNHIKAATQPDKSNEAGERKFTLDEMKDCWESGFFTKSLKLPYEDDMRAQTKYFKETFGIELGERK